MNIILTGAAGFIGFHLAQRLLAAGHCVLGVDNINDYYDVSLKMDRLSILEKSEGFRFRRIDLSDHDSVAAISEMGQFDVIVHLGAQAGVRYSIDNPRAYLDSNISGTLNVLELAKKIKSSHLIYASSSSVYGNNVKIPFSVNDKTDSPASFYAASKKANELMCYTYASLYGIPCTGLRFFTVYGPWGRPDMAYFKFLKNIREGRAIDVYNNGDMRRDFTYVSDVVDGIESMIVKGFKALDGGVPHRVYNLGNNKPESLHDMISIIEEAAGAVAIKNYLPMQAGDVMETYAEISQSTLDYGYVPSVSLREGIGLFVDWYNARYTYK